MKKVLIIGSGLSGLSCARYLDKSKFDIHIFDKHDTAGGRVTSDMVNGCICDVGFQVLLDNYSEVQRLDIYDMLKLQYFDSGAEIYSSGKLLSIYNPLKHPIKFIKYNPLKIFSIKDMYSLVKSLFLKTDTEIANQYINQNFTKRSQELFFYPFFRGVFLSDKLNVDNDFYLKIFKKFALGKASLPLNGMKELPNQIIQKYNLKVSYNEELIKIGLNKVTFKDGRTENFDLIVLAMPINSIKDLIDIDVDPKYNFNKTIYIKSSKSALNRAIMLVAEEKYKTNSIQCLSNIASKYCENSNLYSVSSLYDVTDEELLSEFSSITNISSDDIELIKSYSIKEALPANTETLNSQDNIYFCGDWKSEPSIDGAIKSGRLCAEALNKSQ